MKTITRILLFFFFLQTALKAQSYLAFFEVYRPNGELVQLEKNGRFAHLAISVEGGWLHSHPQKGVEIVSHLDELGLGRYRVVFLANSWMKIKRAQYAHYLNRAYDFDYTWSDEKIYCSELVAKILGFRPMPMDFDSSLWGVQHKGRGELGLSPDEVFEMAKKIHFR